jgi:hypothetical protein
MDHVPGGQVETVGGDRASVGQPPMAAACAIRAGCAVMAPQTPPPPQPERPHHDRVDVERAMSARQR